MFNAALLKETREKRKISQEELGRTIGKSKWTIWRMEKGSIVPTIDEAQKIADRLDLPVSRLMGADNKKAFTVAGEGLNSSNMYLVPVLSREMTACCGNGIPALDVTSDPERFIPWPRDGFRALDDSRPPFGMYTEGDCLESINIRDGDIVLINPAEEPQQGTVALVCYHGMLALRYVYRLRHGEVILRCDVGRITIQPTEIEEGDFAILGTLVGSFHSRPPALPL